MEQEYARARTNRAHRRAEVDDILLEVRGPTGRCCTVILSRHIPIFSAPPTILIVAISALGDEIFAYLRGFATMIPIQTGVLLPNHPKGGIYL